MSASPRQNTLSATAAIRLAIFLVLAAIIAALAYVVLSNTPDAKEAGTAASSTASASTPAETTPASGVTANSSKKAVTVPKAVETVAVSSTPLEDGGTQYTGTGNASFYFEKPDGVDSAAWLEFNWEPAFERDNVTLEVSSYKDDKLYWGTEFLSSESRFRSINSMVDPHLGSTRNMGIETSSNHLRVATNGSWTIKLHPRSSMPHYRLGETIKSSGMAAFSFPPGASKVDVKYTPVSKDSTFSSSVYVADNMAYPNRMTVEPSQVTTLDASNYEYMDISADGDWEVTFTK